MLEREPSAVTFEAYATRSDRGFTPSTIACRDGPPPPLKRVRMVQTGWMGNTLDREDG